MAKQARLKFSSGVVSIEAESQMSSPRGSLGVGVSPAGQAARWGLRGGRAGMRGCACVRLYAEAKGVGGDGATPKLVPPASEEPLWLSLRA